MRKFRTSVPNAMSATVCTGHVTTITDRFYTSALIEVEVRKVSQNCCIITKMNINKFLSSCAYHSMIRSNLWHATFLHPVHNGTETKLM